VREEASKILGLRPMSGISDVGSSLPIRVIITFTDDRIYVEYFLPTGKEMYPYFHVRETWSYYEDAENSFIDVWIKGHLLHRYFDNGLVEIEVSSDNRYAYAEYEYGRRKTRLYAYTTHE
jgi:hypothetical protein